MTTTPKPTSDIERVHAAAEADRVREAEAHAKLTDELDRMRAVADTLGQAFADAAANVRRFVDVWTELVGGDPEIAASPVWFDGMDEAVYVTVGDLRTLIDVDPRSRPDEDDGEIGWHRRHAFAEAERVRARGPVVDDDPRQLHSPGGGTEADPW